VYRNEATFVSNVHADSRCLDVCNVFEQFELNACWSNPIRNAEGASIGSFALSSFECRDPSSFHKELLAVSGHIIGIILERSKQQEQLEVLAYQDPLTGFANRRSLFNKLEHAIQTAGERKASFGILYIDLDRFKIINDSFGHSYGDEILKLIGVRLRERTQGARCLARVGGDEFIIVSEDLSDIDALAESVVLAMSEPIFHENNRFLLDCSIGVAVFPDHGIDTESLLKNADTAMYQAKYGGLNVCYYRSEYGDKAKEEFLTENRLRTAIDNNELQLFYQAKVDAKTHKTTGYEALLRWAGAGGWQPSPSEFIPVAEKTGLMIAIGVWVPRTALANAADLTEATSEPSTMSNNTPGAQLIEINLETLHARIQHSTLSGQISFY